MSATCLSVNHQLSDPLEKVLFESREWTVTGSVLQNIMIVNSDSVHIQVCLLPTWSWWRSGAWWSVIGWGSGTPGWTGGPARWRSERRRTTPRTWHTEQTAEGQTAEVLTNNVVFLLFLWSNDLMPHRVLNRAGRSRSVDVGQYHVRTWSIPAVCRRRVPTGCSSPLNTPSSRLRPSAPAGRSSAHSDALTHNQTDTSLNVILLNFEESKQVVFICFCFVRVNPDIKKYIICKTNKFYFYYF